MTMHISVPPESEEIQYAADGATQALEFVACPECSMTAAVQWRDRLESTDGPVDHVKVTCVNRHWFLMLAESLTKSPRNRHN